jgi:hypothetical protein
MCACALRAASYSTIDITTQPSREWKREMDIGQRKKRCWKGSGQRVDRLEPHLKTTHLAAIESEGKRPSLP